MRGRIQVIWGLLLILALVLGACAVPVAAPAGGAAAPAAGGEAAQKLTVYLQCYYDPTVEPGDGEDRRGTCRRISKTRTQTSRSSWSPICHPDRTTKHSWRHAWLPTSRRTSCGSSSAPATCAARHGGRRSTIHSSSPIPMSRRASRAVSSGPIFSRTLCWARHAPPTATGIRHRWTGWKPVSITTRSFCQGRRRPSQVEELEVVCRRHEDDQGKDRCGSAR